MLLKSSYLIFLVVTFALLTPGWSIPKLLNTEIPVYVSPEPLQQINTLVQDIINTALTNGVFTCGNGFSFEALNLVKVKIGPLEINTEIDVYDGNSNIVLEIQISAIGEGATTVKCNGLKSANINSLDNVAANALSITNIVKTQLVRTYQ